MSRRTGPKLLRIIVAFGAFVAVLCGGLYLGFVMKFQTANITKKTTVSAAPVEPLFYKRIGKKQAHSDHKTSGTKAPASQRYALEFKVFRQQAAAETYVRRLTRQGIQAYYTPLQHKGRVIFRVREGLYPNHRLAQKAAANFKENRNISANIVKLQ